MDKLPKNIQVYLALMMDTPEVLSLCKSFKNINENVCKNKSFWISKLKKDFNVLYTDLGSGDPKDYYKFFLESEKYNKKYIYRFIGKSGRIALLVGSRSLWNNNPNIIYIPDFHIYGNPNDIEEYLRNKGFSKQFIESQLNKAYTSTNYKTKMSDFNKEIEEERKWRANNNKE